MKEGEKMTETTGSCPYCGAAINGFDSRAWLYGSPVRTCGRCGNKYIDRRYHEIAIDGVAPDAFSVDKSRKMLLFSLVCIAVSIVFCSITYFLNGTVTRGGIAIGILGAVIAVCMLVDIIRTKSGAKERRFEALRKESEERLSDREYAVLLSENGYKVPEKYINN